MSDSVGPPLPCLLQEQERAPRPRPGASLPRIDGLLLALITAAAIAGNLALRTGVSSASATIAVILTAAVLLRPTAGSTDASHPSAAMTACVVVAVGFALLLSFRASTWLAWLNSFACVASLAGLALARGGRPPSFNTSGLGALTRRFASGFAAPWMLGRSLRPAGIGSFSRLVPIARGVLLAFVPIVILGSLLASADAVFAAAINPDIDMGNSIGHVAMTCFCMLAIVALIAIAETHIEETTTPRHPLGAIEALVLLGSLALLFAGFAAVQLFGALGQTDNILARQGVTAADYARDGFFQLLWVAALTGLLLAAVQLLVAEGSHVVTLLMRWAGTVVALLTCVIVAVAVVRLDLYTDAFGQTTLRWYCTAFAWMLGAAFLLIAAAQFREFARWIPITLVSLTAATLLVVNVLNAESRVAEHNLARTDATTELDTDYLLRLSADAWPVLMQNDDLIVPQIPGDGARRFAQACAGADKPRGFGPFGFNTAQTRLSC